MKAVRISSVAEREILAIMEGGCHAPIGAYAKIEAQTMELFAFVSDLEGRRYIKKSIKGEIRNWRSLAGQLAEELLKAGGQNILEELSRNETR